MMVVGLRSSVCLLLLRLGLCKTHTQKKWITIVSKHLRTAKHHRRRHENLEMSVTERDIRQRQELEAQITEAYIKHTVIHCCRAHLAESREPRRFLWQSTATGGRTDTANWQNLKRRQRKRSPSSAFLSHSTNFFICSRKTLFPLARWASLYHFRIASSLRTSAVGNKQNKIKKNPMEKDPIQHDANSTDASTGAWKTNVAQQVDDINQERLLAIISGHLASFTCAYIVSPCQNEVLPQIDCRLQHNKENRTPVDTNNSYLCRAAQQSFERPSWSGCCHSSTPGSSAGEWAQRGLGR